MKYFEFYNTTKVIIAEDALKQLPIELERIGGKRALLISGPVLTRIGAVDRVKSYFEGASAQIVALFNQVPNDSELDVVNNIVKVYKENDCDCIIAAGGGSVMDTAKAVRLVLINNADDIREYTGMEMSSKGKHVPFVVIPTTSGTGSEVTKVAVITDKTRNVKMEFITGETLPDFCILDPSMTSTLPKRPTFTTAFDTLTHAIEGYTGTQSQPLTDMFALQAIKKVAENVETAVAEPENVKARLGMLEAAMLAGISFSNSMVGVVHGIGHAVGGVAHVGHDVAMTILLPACMEFNLDYLEKKYANVYFYLNYDGYMNTSDKDKARACINHIRGMIKKYHEEIGVPMTLSQAGVTEDQIPAIVHTALKDGAMLANVKAVTADDVEKILRAAF